MMPGSTIAAGADAPAAKPKPHPHQQKRARTAKDLRNAAAGANQRDTSRKGANGVKLKRFEAVMCDVFSTKAGSNEVSEEALRRLTPRYSKLPPFVDDATREKIVENAKSSWNERGLVSGDMADVAAGGRSPWPFDASASLPRCGHVRGELQQKQTARASGKGVAGVGDVRNAQRALRKEMQLSNLIQCVLALLPDDVLCPTSESKKFRIVDFAGGTGKLAVPLALMLPHCEVVCVDLKKWSLDLLHNRVDGTSGSNETAKNDEDKSHKQPIQSSTIQQSKMLPNLSTYHGTIQTYPDEFDIGVSLHACGEASDWVLRKCIQRKASFVVCSCCCGKLRQSAKNPYVFQSTGANEKEIKYPQCKVFAELGGCIEVNSGHQTLTSEQFDEIARAADYSELGDLRKPKNACRRAAKSLVEWDRLLYANERMIHDKSKGSDANVVLTRMQPWEASPKNDILIGWFGASSNPYLHTKPPEDDLTCDADFQVALDHLFGNSISKDGHIDTSAKKLGNSVDQNDWTAEEEAEIKSTIEDNILKPKMPSFKFPTGMGPRKRKIVHYVAEGMGLRHWGEGKRDSEKRVVVALAK